MNPVKTVLEQALAEARNRLADARAAHADLVEENQLIITALAAASEGVTQIEAEVADYIRTLTTLFPEPDQIPVPDPEDLPESS